MNTNARRGLGRGLGELLNRADAVADGQAGEAAPADESIQLDETASAAPRHEFSSNADAPGQTAWAADRTAGSADAGEAGDVPDARQNTKIPEGSYFAEIAVDSIRANPKQPRGSFDDDDQQELVDSVADIGVLQPIVVRPVEAAEDFDDGSRYELVMGERRWRAVRTAGLDTIPAIVRRTEDHAMLRDALLENLHRTELNPLEEASAYRQLLDDFDCTQEELASRIKRSRPQISNTLRLLRLPPAVQRRVAAGVLSAGHARALVMMEDLSAQERLAQRIVAEGLSVRASEELATLGGEPAKPTRTTTPSPEPSPRMEELSDRLSETLDTRVRVSTNRSRGKITIDFATADDLERIAELISPPPSSPAGF
jgi:ParB family chromosome partitioning protein